MKKAVLLAAAFAIVATSAFATDSRDQALQTQGWMVMDDVNVGLLPAEVLKYNKLAVAELGGPNGPYMNMWSPVISGLLVKVGPLPGNDGVDAIGDYGNTVGGTTNVTGPWTLPNTGSPSAGVPLGRIGVLYGWDMGGMGLAAGVDYYNTVAQNDKDAPDTGPDTTVVDQSNAIVINGGLSTAVAMLDPLSVGVQITMPSMKWATETNTETSLVGSGMGLGINARGRLVDAVGKGVVTFVYAGFQTGSVEFTSTTADVTDGTETLSGNTISVGVANNVKVGENSLIICGVGLSMDSGSIALKADASGDEVTEEGSSMTMPVTVGFETQAMKGITVRVSSMSQVIGSTNGKTSSNITGDGEDTTSSDTGANNLAVGATYELSDNFAIDAVVNQGFLWCGPYFLSGISGGPICTNLSLVGRF